MSADEPFETFEHAGMTVKLYQDYDAEDPFETFDQLAELVWTERDYAYKNVNGQVSIDHKHYLDPDNFSSVAHMQRFLTLMEGYLVAVPFYLADYGSGGRRVDTVAIDADRVSGFLVVSEKRRELMGSPLEGLEENAMLDFRQWKAWVEEEVGGYVVESPDGDVLDSCWGFYGEVDYVRKEAREAAEAEAETWLEDPPRKSIRVELTQKQAAAVLEALPWQTSNGAADPSLQSAHAMLALELADREQKDAAALAHVREAQQEAAPA